MSLFDAPLAFVDVETTGGHPARDRVIEVGVVSAAAGELEYEWSTLVNPGVPIPLSIQHLTGITDEMVRHAPFFEEIAGDLAGKLEDRLFVAHNARFDYGFVRHELRRVGLKLTNRTACTVKLSRRLHPEMPRHNLDAVIERHGLKCADRHRALGDARALWQFFQMLRAERSHDEVEQALAAITYLKSLPPHLPPELADDLPEKPGVYRFMGEDDVPLYIGKAKNIRARVMQHWQGASTDAKAQKLGEMTRRIEWTETAGELGALLLESRQVREMKPLHNRALRGHGQVFTWIVADDGAKPLLAPLDQWPLSFEPSDAFGLFRNEAAARKALLGIAHENKLCLKMLGLEKAAGSCFGHAVGKCVGTCVGKESLRLHAARVKMALLPHRLKPWPFAGVMGIRESNGEGLEQVHVIDDWRHLGTIEEGDAMPQRRELQPFNIDVYHILARYLLRKARSSQVFPIAVEQDFV